MSGDIQYLLWEQLNKLYVKDAKNSLFVLSTGKELLYSDYSPTFFPRQAEHNTFDLVDTCIACNVYYTLTGSRISTQWQQLLYNGKGPPAGPEQQAAFDKAKAWLYKNYDTREPTDLYNKYNTANADFEAKNMSLRAECQQEHGDKWKTYYDEQLPTTVEYQEFQRLNKDVAPLLQAIDEWMYGPLISVMAPMKTIFEDNERSVVLPDGESKTYRYVSMIPTNWYQRLDPNHPDDDSWIKINVGNHIPNDDSQSKEYNMLGGKPTTSGFVDFNQLGGNNLQEKKVDIGASQDVTIDLKVCSVQINRPWIDLSALNFQDWRIPGLHAGAWSTGVIDSSNTGSFPLLSTQMVMAKDITVTSADCSQELDHTLKAFNPSVDSAIVGGIFNIGASTNGTTNFKYDTKSNSIILDGTQVIGYVCTLLPKYPA